MSKNSAKDLGSLSLIEEHRSSKKTKTKRSKFFYEVANHQEFFKMAGSYYSDFQKGIKSFAFSSTGYHSSQQKCILGVASFFDHREDPSILIVSENLTQGAFKPVMDETFECSFPFSSEEEIDTLQVHSFYDHFDLMNLDTFLKLENNNETGLDQYEVVDQVFSSYDLVLWDVPHLNKIQESPEFYYPMIMKFDYLSVIVSHSKSKEKDIKSVIDFYSDYGIQLKGFLVDGGES